MWNIAIFQGTLLRRKSTQPAKGSKQWHAVQPDTSSTTPST